MALLKRRCQVSSKIRYYSPRQTKTIGWTAKDERKGFGLVFSLVGLGALLFGIFSAPQAFRSLSLVISGNQVSLSVWWQVATPAVAVSAGLALLRMGLGLYFARNKKEAQRIIRRLGK